MSDQFQDLMALPGATAVGQFDDKGGVVSYQGDMDQTSAEIAAMMCFANKAMGNMQAKGWAAYTGSDDFFPVQGFAVAGGKHAACVMGDVGVFLDADQADFDQTFAALSKHL